MWDSGPCWGPALAPPPPRAEPRAPARSPLVLLVGKESGTGRRLARGLIARDYAVVSCAGPPGCALVRDDACVLLRTADVAVVLPTWSADKETAVGLSLCVGQARRAVVVEPTSAVRSRPDVVTVRSADPETVAGAIERVLARPSP